MSRRAESLWPVIARRVQPGIHVRFASDGSGDQEFVRESYTQNYGAITGNFPRLGIKVIRQGGVANLVILQILWIQCILIVLCTIFGCGPDNQLISGSLVQCTPRLTPAPPAPAATTVDVSAGGPPRGSEPTEQSSLPIECGGIPSTMTPVGGSERWQRIRTGPIL